MLEEDNENDDSAAILYLFSRTHIHLAFAVAILRNVRHQLRSEPLTT
jgi:hypothetical protein